MRSNYVRIFSLGLSLLCLTPAAKAALVVGDTFGLSINASPADQSSYQDINTTINHTFANGTVNLGSSAFNPTVQLELTMEEVEVSATNSIINIELVGRDATGALANPIGDGSVAASGSPFTILWMDLGIFNGGTDLLTPNTPYVVNSAFAGMVNTADEAAGGTPTLQSDSPLGISYSIGFNVGADVATTDLQAAFGAAAFPTQGEFAGWTAQFDVTAVPEPSSVGVIAILAFAGATRRRRN